MKKYVTFLLPLATVCIIGTIGLQGLALVVAALSSDNIGNGMPLKFFERLDLPIMSIALPVIGMLLFVACLLGLNWRSRTEESKVVKTPAKRTMTHGNGPDRHLKAA